MRNVNLAHGSLFLLGGYLGFEISERTGSWLLAFPVVLVIVAILGMILQNPVFRRMEGEELRQTMVTLGLSVVLADLMLWVWGGQSYTIQTPDWLAGPAEVPIFAGTDRSGNPAYLRYPAVRIAILIAAIVIGVAIGAVLIGLGFLAVVFFSPDGVPGLWDRWQARRAKRKNPLTGSAP